MSKLLLGGSQIECFGCIGGIREDDETIDCNRECNKEIDLGTGLVWKFKRQDRNVYDEQPTPTRKASKSVHVFVYGRLEKPREKSSDKAASCEYSAPFSELCKIFSINQTSSEGQVITRFSVP